MKLETKYKIDDAPPYEGVIEDDLNNEPESVDEKSKKIGDVVEPTLEAPAEIEFSDNIRKMEQEWLDQFLQEKDNKSTQQELNDKAIAQVLSEETDNPQMLGKIENMLIDDDERFAKDYITEQDKEFIQTLLHKNNSCLGDDDIDNIDFEVAKRIPLPDSDSDDDVTYVKYIPLPPNSPIQPSLHPYEWLK